MRKIVVCIVCLFSMIFAESLISSVKTEVVEIKFDYSRYLAPTAFKAIEESQGILFVSVPTFSDHKVGWCQAVVFDDKERLILSVGHGLEDFPSVAFSKDTSYLFLYRGAIFRARLVYVSKDIYDLAIFKLEIADENKDIKLKPVVLRKPYEPFGEYYALSQNPGFKEKVGLCVSVNLPFRGNLVGTRLEKTVDYLFFDKGLKPGFSGSGVFDKNGEMIGMFRATYYGYSIAISSASIEMFMEEYRESLKK